MFGSNVLDFAIGLIFVFFLVSLVCSQVGSKVSEVLDWRAKHLENGIRTLILNGNDELTQKLYSSSLIKSLAPEGKKPIWIPTKTLLLALFDTFVKDASGKTKIDELRDSIVKMSDDSPVKPKLLALVTAAGDKVDGLMANFDGWFNSVEDRMSATYRQKMWLFGIGIGLAVSILLNVDAVAVGTSLWRDSALRSAVVTAASDYTSKAVQSNDPLVTQQNAQKAIQTLGFLNLPIGWQVTTQPAFTIIPMDWAQTAPPANLWTVILKLVGWIITGLAGAQGAPFWFDVLKRVTNR